MGKRVEMTAMRADGSEFPVELAITRIPIDGPPSFTGYLRDITERKQSEEELRRSEAFLAEAQQLSSTGSFSWRVATDEITWSEADSIAFSSLTPVMPVTLELIGARVHPEDIPSCHDMLESSAPTAIATLNTSTGCRCPISRSNTCTWSLMRPGTRNGRLGVHWRGSGRDAAPALAKRHSARHDRNSHTWPESRASEH